jgi:hypothetical protein
MKESEVLFTDSAALLYRINTTLFSRFYLFSTACFGRVHCPSSSEIHKIIKHNYALFIIVFFNRKGDAATSTHTYFYNFVNFYLMMAGARRRNMLYKINTSMKTVLCLFCKN